MTLSWILPLAWNWKVKVAQSCPTLCDLMDYTVHGILQASILEWVAFPFSSRSSQPRDWTQVSHMAGGSHRGSPRILGCVAYLFSRGSSRPRNRTRVSCTAGRFLTSWATREDPFSVTDTGLYDRWLHAKFLTETAKLFSRVTVPFYIPTNIWMIHFLCILACIWYCHLREKKKK